jgi:uncharacterized protein YjbI with pentapeptide repeats
MADENRPRRLVSADWIRERIQNGKDVRLKSAIIEGDLDLSNLDLPRNANRKVIIDSEIRMTKCRMRGSVNFESTIIWQADFSGTKFFKFANFLVAEISRADFAGAQFCENAQFLTVIFHQYADFESVIFNGNATFEDSLFAGANFSGSIFNEDADFRDVNINGGASFERAKFCKEVWFNRAKFNGETISFKEAKFSYPRNQEYACRKAKNLLTSMGDREGEEYHFYREMEAKRIQKGIRGNSRLGLGYLLLKTDTWSFWRYLWYDGIEWIFVQMMFGYGVHFERLIASWVIIVVLFAGLYYRSDVISGVSNAFDCLKVSFATAIAPGYIAVIINPGNSTGGYKITSGYYQATAMVETLFGTFLWAGFIATFAKKYMR